jgi:hypothetical protein
LPVVMTITAHHARAQGASIAKQLGGIICNGNIVFPQSDNNNCGSCGNKCVSPMSCEGGACTCPSTGGAPCAGGCCPKVGDTCCNSTHCCSLGTTCCGSTCCPTGQRCVNGSCVGPCQPGIPACTTNADCNLNQFPAGCVQGCCSV